MKQAAIEFGILLGIGAALGLMFADGLFGG